MNQNTVGNKKISLTPISVPEPKTCVDVFVDVNSYFNRMLFNRKICRGILKIFRFMQSRNIFFHLRFILTVLKHKYLKIGDTHEAQYTFRMFCYKE